MKNFDYNNVTEFGEFGNGVTMFISDARKEQAMELASLFQLAGEGLPFYLWQIESHGRIDPLKLGAMRLASDRDRSQISYQNARVCLRDGRLAGAALSYKLPDNPSLLALHQHPDPQIPLLMLETKAPGAWYLNALAVAPQFRNFGIAKQLMYDVALLAQENTCIELALIVNSANHNATSLYGKLGYTIKDQLPVVPYPNCASGSHWVLMTAPTESQLGPPQIKATRSARTSTSVA